MSEAPGAGTRAARPARAAIPCLGFAASGLLLCTLLGCGRQTPPRGDARVPAPPATIAIEPAHPMGRGIELGWREVAGAERYRVTLYTPDLAEIATLGPVASPPIVVTRADLPASVRPRTRLSWRVTALRDSREVATSALGSLVAP